MATIASNGTGGGLASAGASWAGGVAPVDGDKVNIVSGDTITLDNTFTWGDDTTTAINVKSGGILKASRSASSELICKGSVIIESGGTLDYGKSGGDNIPSAYTAKMRLNYSASILNDKYSLTIASGGKFYSFGVTKTKTTLLNGALAVGATSAVFDSVTEWAVGDLVVFTNTDTSSNNTRYDLRQIATINAGTKTITFTATTYAHADRCEVGNLSSNVTFTSHTTGANKQGYIGWTISNASGNHEAQYTSFLYLGQSNNSVNFLGGGATNGLLIFNNNSVAFSAGPTSGHVMMQCNYPNITIDNCNFFTNVASNNSGTDIFFYGGSNKTIISNCVFLGRSAGSNVSSGGSQGGVAHIFNDCKFLGAQQGIAGGFFNYTVNRCYFYSMSNYAVAGSFTDTIVINNSYLGYGGVGSRNVANVSNMSGGTIQNAIFTDCYFNYSGGVTNPTSQYAALPSCRIVVANKNLDPAQQEIYTVGGNLIRDNSIFKAGTASLRFDRIPSAIYPAQNQWYIFAPTGKAVTVTGYLRKNASYGSATLPYVTLSGLGIVIDTSTMTDVNDTWWQFKVAGTQTTGTDGMLTLSVYFQSANASASAWIDEISAVSSAAVNSGGLEYWAAGQPAQIIAANYVAPIDVWNVLASACTLTGSQGLQANNTAIKADDACILRGII